MMLMLILKLNMRMSMVMLMLVLLMLMLHGICLVNVAVIEKYVVESRMHELELTSAVCHC